MSNPLITEEKSAIGSLLVTTSIITMAACFGNFAFTYEKTNIQKTFSRIIAHATTGLLMFLIGLSLEMTAILSTILIGDFTILNIGLLILYISSILYDFWDLERSNP